jgi:hypothetical protein
MLNLSSSNLILVEFDVEDFPLANADAGMTALVSLVTVMAAEILHRAIIRDFDLIDEKKTEALTTETFVCLLT